MGGISRSSEFELSVSESLLSEYNPRPGNTPATMVDGGLTTWLPGATAIGFSVLAGSGPDLTSAVNWLTSLSSAWTSDPEGKILNKQY